MNSKIQNIIGNMLRIGGGLVGYDGMQESNQLLLALGLITFIAGQIFKFREPGR